VATAPAGAASSRPRGTCTRRPCAPTAAQSASTTGITPKSVTGGQRLDHLGSCAGSLEGASIGVKAYFDMINAQGGVDAPQVARVDRQRTTPISGGSLQNMTETQEASTATSHWWEFLPLSTFHAGSRRALRDRQPRCSVSVTSTPDERAARTTSAATAVGHGDLGPVATTRSTTPKDTDRGRNRLGRLLRRDPDGSSNR